MTWLPIPFPPRLAYGLGCDVEWDTRVATTISGQEGRNLSWTDARHMYDAAFCIRTLSDHQTIREHFHMARGRFHSWPLTDPTDHECDFDSGVVADADAGFQLHKRYGSGSYAYDRKITRPSGVEVYVGSELQTLGVDYTLDLATGVLVVADSDVVAADVAWLGQFSVPCRYDINRLPVRVENRTGGANGEFLIRSDGIQIVEVRE